MKTQTKQTYAEHVIREARGARVDFSETDELLMLLGKTWSDHAETLAEIKQLVFRQSVLTELTAIRIAAEKIAAALKEKP